MDLLSGGENLLLKQTQFLGSAYDFGVTAMKVYNTTSVTGACREAAKGIVMDCAPPVYKYLALCSALLVNGLYA